MKNQILQSRKLKIYLLKVFMIYRNMKIKICQFKKMIDLNENQVNIFINIQLIFYVLLTVKQIYTECE